MGSKGGGQATTQTITPTLPDLPNQQALNSQAQNRLLAGSPWMNSPWRSMDLVAGQSPTQYLPQFTPPGAAPGVGGGVQPQAGGAPPGQGGGTQFYGGGATGGFGSAPGGQQQGVPGFYNPSPGPPGPGMQMPTTPTGQQALAQNTSPGLMGMMQFLSQLGQQGGGGQQPGVQPPAAPGTDQASQMRPPPGTA